jgi:hypothetical protein
MWNAYTGEVWQASKWGAMRERPDELEVEQLRRAKQILTVSLERRHSAIGYDTPIEFERSHAPDNSQTP